MNIVCFVKNIYEDWENLYLKKGDNLVNRLKNFIVLPNIYNFVIIFIKEWKIHFEEKMWLKTDEK